MALILFSDYRMHRWQTHLSLGYFFNNAQNITTLKTEYYRLSLCFQSHTLEAVLLLLKDLDEEELQLVHTATQNMLQSYMADSETFKDSLQTQNSADIQQWFHCMHSGSKHFLLVIGGNMTLDHDIKSKLITSQFVGCVKSLLVFWEPRCVSEPDDTPLCL